MKNNIKNINWDNWNPKIKATLLFVFNQDEVLLIHKKTGLGKGKINAPGGKIEEGESPEECAIRETFEEVCIMPSDINKGGELFFQFVDGLTIHGHVFYTDTYSGIPKETDEAKPFWCPIDEIPYENMWEDDITWLPSLLSKDYFKGYYIFDDEKMIEAYVSTDF